MIQPAIKSIHENNKINKTEVPFTIIPNISEKKKTSHKTFPEVSVLPMKLCVESERQVTDKFKIHT